MILGTLWLSWQLEGAAAAINDTGSLRMRSNRLALSLVAGTTQSRPQAAAEEIAGIESILAELQRGNPVRPLFLPSADSVHTQMDEVAKRWQSDLKPAALSGMSGNANDYLQRLPEFITQTNRLVSLIESDNASKIALLRLSQGVLIVIACVGTLTMIYLLYLWIIVPVLQLQQGLQRMAAHDFSTRLPVESSDEFGVLTQGFNRMAAELGSLYGALEARVQKKTSQLAAQNRELAALYDMAAFLNRSINIDEMCRGFLQRVMQQFAADGGSIRVIETEGDKLHLVASEGLSSELEDHEHCMSVDACFCGTATRQGVVVINDLNRMSAPTAREMGCRKEGFAGIAVFRIVTQNAVLGSFSLHFRTPHSLSLAEKQLLEAFGQHLGIALENHRLSAQARQLAVAAERNLVAQGLHDSIAQGLNYLNLQVQMLNDAAQRSAIAEVREIVPSLQIGVNESYQDVRELLLNFRSKLEAGELKTAVADTLARFERQTGIPIALDMDELNGAPLPPEQQLQVIFILQEALSNVRKHAHASKVTVRILNCRDFELHIEDDGCGFEPAQFSGESDKQHVGLNIMQERAARLHAALDICSARGQGTHISLILPCSERKAA